MWVFLSDRRVSFGFLMRLTIGLILTCAWRLGPVTYQNSLKVAWERQTFLFAHRCWGTFREEERLRLSNRNSILMTQNLCGMRSEALYIGRRSSFVVLAIVYEWQTKDKTPQRSNVNTMNLLNKTANICGIKSSLEEAFEFCWSSFADAHNTLPKSTRRNVKLNKFAFGTPWLPDLLCKHWFTSLVWNFCRWVADVPPRETSPSGDERGETSAVRKLQRKELTRIV